MTFAEKKWFPYKNICFWEGWNWVWFIIWCWIEVWVWVRNFCEFLIKIRLKIRKIMEWVLCDKFLILSLECLFIHRSFFYLVQKIHAINKYLKYFTEPHTLSSSMQQIQYNPQTYILSTYICMRAFDSHKLAKCFRCLARKIKSLCIFNVDSWPG